jgi:hypothetical protein
MCSFQRLFTAKRGLFPFAASQEGLRSLRCFEGPLRQWFRTARSRAISSQRDIGTASMSCSMPSGAPVSLRTAGRRERSTLRARFRGCWATASRGPATCVRWRGSCPRQSSSSQFWCMSSRSEVSTASSPGVFRRAGAALFVAVASPKKGMREAAPPMPVAFSEKSRARQHCQKESESHRNGVKCCGM